MIMGQPPVKMMQIVSIACLLAYRCIVRSAVSNKTASRFPLQDF